MNFQAHSEFIDLPRVRPELEATLAHAQLALEAYAGDPSRREAMQDCAADLNQVRGSLDQLGLHAAAAAAREMGSLARLLLDGHVAGREAMAAVLRRGFEQLPVYLECLSAGQPEPAVALLPLINDLRASHGEAALHAADLFSPELDTPLPAQAPGAQDDADDEIRRRELAGLRLRFQQALLVWFRGQEGPRPLSAMSEALDEIAAHCASLRARRLWWIAAGVLEGLEQGALRAQAGELRPLIGKVDRSIRVLAEQGEDALSASEDELARKLLYFAAQAEGHTPRLDQLRHSYRLDRLLPGVGESAQARVAMSGGSLAPPEAAALKRDLQQVKEALDLYLRRPGSGPAALAPQLAALQRIDERLGRVDFEVPRRVAEEQRRVLGEIVDGIRPADEDSLLDVAGALLYIESLLDEHATSAESSNAAAQHADEDLREIFVEELQATIEHLRSAVPAWLAAPEQLPLLAPIRNAFHTLKGSGRLVGASLLGDFAERIERLLNRVLDRRIPAQTEVQALVGQSGRLLSGLLDELQGRAPVPAELPALMAQAECLAADEAEPDPAGLEAQLAGILDAPEPAPAAGLPEIDPVLLEILRSEVAEHVQTLRAQAADPARRVDDALVRAVHTLHGALAMVELSVLTELLAPLEGVLKRLRDESRALPADGAELLAGTADAVARVMAQFESAQPRLPELAALRSRLVAWRDAEAGPAAAPVDNGEPAIGSLASELDPELLDLFVEEARDLLDHADGELAQWHAETGEAGHVVAGLRRDLHTLKGSARIAGLAPLGDLAHAMESLLGRLAGGPAAGGSALAALEDGFDRLHAMVQQVAQGKAPVLPRAAIAQLLALSGSGDSDGDDAPADALPDPAPPSPGPLAEPQDEARSPHEQIRVRADLLDSLVEHAGEVAIYRSRLEQQVAGYRFNLVELEQTVTRLREQLRMLEIEAETQLIARFQREHREAGLPAFDPLELDRYSPLQQYSRALAESVSDLMALQGLLDELTRQAEGLLIQQSRVSAELQDGLLRTRMLPFDSMVPNLRRTLRQAAQDLGKSAQLYVDGAHGEMDRNLLERLKAPFEHMLRNAAAHGIESPEQRRAAGKPAEGAVHIQVAREATEVVIRFSDDGRGLDRTAIRARALERGLIAADARLDDEQWLALIVQPGFSTAGALTQLAGRGVGMDVVASEIRQFGGALAVESTPGQGTTFVLRLPFTLAVTEAILVRVGEASFAIPMASVQGVAQIAAETLAAQLAEAEPAYVHRSGPGADEERYGIHRLTDLLGLPPGHAGEEGRLPLLLIRAGELRAAIHVDAVLGSREIVVKPVGPQVSSVPGVLGATLMGDGSVVVILDPAPLLRRDLARRRGRAQTDASEVSAARLPEQALPWVMVVDDSITMRKVTGRVLERHGYAVSTAKDGIDALEQLHERVPDLLLLDIEMPRMDGYELAEQLKLDPRLRKLPIVMITSRTGDKHRQRALDLGVDAYLGKPYQEAELLAHIRRLLAGKSMDGAA